MLKKGFPAFGNDPNQQDKNNYNEQNGKQIWDADQHPPPGFHRHKKFRKIIDPGLDIFSGERMIDQFAVGGVIRDQFVANTPCKNKREKTNG